MDSQNIDPQGQPVQLGDAPQLDTSSPIGAPAEPKPAINPFLRLWEMGYRRLVPIVPPLAELSPHSSLFRRPASRGKAVGEEGPHGWRSWNWPAHETTREDCVRWCAMGAGVGTRTGFGLSAIDIDTLDPELSARAMATAHEILGPAARRIGRAPKVSLLYRVEGPAKYQRVQFVGAGGKTEMVELLGEGRQSVMGGIHPGTMEPYRWPDGVPAYDDLTLVSQDQIDVFFERLVKVMPEARGQATAAGNLSNTDVDQNSLRGEIEAVRAALAAIPNDRSDRDFFIRICAATKASLPDEPEEALTLAWEWASQYVHTDGSPKTYDSFMSDWNGIRAPFRLGAPYLYDKASAATGQNMTPAERFFEPVPEGSVNTSAFLDPDTAQEKQRSATSDTFELLSIDDLFQMSDPKYLIGRHLPENALGFLYGDPGTGKSFIALDWALHIAFGMETWHGDPINAPPDAHVVYIAGEGAAGLKSRVRAWMHRHAVGDAKDRFKLLDKSVDLMNRDEAQKLARTIRAGAPGTVLVVVDTVSRSMPGADENQQKEMTRFVQACDAIRTEFQCVVLGVHHAARQGGNMRGSTVLSGAGDFIFKLDRKPAAVAGKLTCEKQKDAPDGWRQPYRFDEVAYPGGTSLVPTRCLTADGDGAPVPAAQEEQILQAIDEAWWSGEPWGQGAQSRDRYAVTQLVKGFGFKTGRAQELIQSLQDQGLIAVEVVDRKSKKTGYRRLAMSSATASSGNVFD